MAFFFTLWKRLVMPCNCKERIFYGMDGGIIRPTIR